MSNNFFNTEVALAGPIGGGGIYTGLAVVNNGIAGMAGLQDVPKLALTSVLKVFEGYGLSVGEDKVSDRHVKAALRAGKFIVPGTIFYDVANYVSQKQTGNPLEALAAQKGALLQSAAASKIRGLSSRAPRSSAPKSTPPASAPRSGQPVV